MSTTPLKKRKLLSEQSKEKVKEINGNISFKDQELQENLKEIWKKNITFKEGDIRIDSVPFRYGEIENFLDGGDKLEEYVEKFKTFEFEEKGSDLFQFKQSLDLKSYVDPHVHTFMEYLSSKVLTFMKNVTGLPLNDHIDLFLSEYQQTDFLLCHDDELDSRRIAFILYLTKEWKSDFGGNLDLFTSTKELHPKEIVTSITPQFNKFVFFEVGPTSFHQVNEVRAEKVSRLALSGWFYGDPLPRPKINFPQDPGYILKDFIFKNPSKIFDKFCCTSYLSPSTCSDINEGLTEESQVLIPAFLLPSVYSAICEDIVEQDVSKSTFKPVGPPNICAYEETAKGPPEMTLEPQGSVMSGSQEVNLQSLVQFFHSQDFLKFLETITEFPFTSCEIAKMTSSLRKYSAGCYSLMKSGGKKQTGGLISQLKDKVKGQISEVENDEVKGEDSEEEDEDPNYVDVIFYFGSKWKESWGGLTIYSTNDGEQLITIPPEGNCLAIVVRTQDVNSYVNYINCHAKDEVYFSYNMTFSFNGTL